MGISKNLIPVIAETFSFQTVTGSLLMLGRQDIEGGQSPEAFFEGLGCSPVESMDVSSFEGATIVFDLNLAQTPLDLVDRFDCIFDGGTLEHVFNLPNAFARCGEMLKVGGHFAHIGPMNNYVDHGFFQFSPTLWFDWFAANDWVIVESIMVGLPSQASTETGWSFSFLPPNRLGRVGQLDERPYMHFWIARKTPSSRWDRVPIQSIYAPLFGKEGVNHAPGLREFAPFTVVDGIAKEHAMPAAQI